MQRDERPAVARPRDLRIWHKAIYLYIVELTNPF